MKLSGLTVSEHPLKSEISVLKIKSRFSQFFWFSKCFLMFDVFVSDRSFRSREEA